MSRSEMHHNGLTKKIIIAAIVVAFLVGGFFGAKIILLPKFHDWRQEKILSQAKEALEADQHADALLLVRKGLQRYPDNQEYWELGVEVAEKMDSPEALRFSVRLEEKEPSLENKYKVIEIATKYRVLGRAIEMLDSLPPEAAQNKRTHELALQVYMLLNNSTKIKSHLRSLVSIDPEDHPHALQLALTELAETNRPADPKAVEKIQELSKKIGRSKEAYSPLLNHAIRTNDEALAERLLAQLDEFPDLGADEIGLKLSTLKTFDLPGYDESLDLLLATKEPSPSQASVIIRRLTQLKEVDRAVEWHRQLSDELKSKPQVQSAIVFLHADNRDFRKANELLIGGNWGRLEYERLSLLAYTYDQLDETSARNEAWSQAIGEAGSNFDALQSLRRTANIRRWNDQLIETFRAIFKTYPNDREAFGTLVLHDQEIKNTNGLLRTFSRRLEANPEELDTKNNVAYLNLITRQETQRSLQLSKETHESDPQSSHYAYTYALALISNDKPQAALDLIGEYEEELLLNDSRRITKALALAQLEKFADANNAIKFIERDSLLPGEQDLLLKVKSMVVKANLYVQNESYFEKLRKDLTPSQANTKLVPASFDAGELPFYENALVLFRYENFSEMQIQLQDADWDESEYMRFAVLSYAQKLQSESRLADSSWEAAISEARSDSEKLQILQEFSALHSLRDRETEIANLRFQRNPRDDELFALLEERAIEAEDEEMLRETYQRKATTVSSRTADVPMKLAYYYLVTQQNPIEAIRLVERNEGLEDLNAKKTRMLIAIRNEKPSLAQDIWLSLSSIEQQNESVKLIESQIRLLLDSEPRAQLLFSKIDSTKLLFFEKDYYSRVRRLLTQ